MAELTVAALQADILWEDPSANFERLESWIRKSANLGADLLVLPEMFACGFSMNTDRIAEAVDGPSTQFLRQQARHHGLWLAGSVPERAQDGSKPHNTLLLIGPGGETHRYRKIHPFTYADEHRHYEAGESFTTVEVGGVRITLFICYDLRFADEFWATAEDTDAYIVVANWPEARRHHWRTLIDARAIENQAYVIGVNRVGEGGRLRYLGDSRIVDPMGEVLASAAGEETLLLAKLSSEKVNTTRQTFPFLRDRRPAPSSA